MHTHHFHLPLVVPGSKETVREALRRQGGDREGVVGRRHGGGSGDTVVVQANAVPAGPSLQQAEVAKSSAGSGRLVILISTGCFLTAPS